MGTFTTFSFLYLCNRFSWNSKFILKLTSILNMYYSVVKYDRFRIYDPTFLQNFTVFSEEMFLIELLGSDKILWENAKKHLIVRDSGWYPLRLNTFSSPDLGDGREAPGQNMKTWIASLWRANSWTNLSHWLESAELTFSSPGPCDDALSAYSINNFQQNDQRSS